MGVTLLVSGIPHYVTLSSLAYHLNILFDTDEIGTFKIREIQSYTPKRQLALDFNTGFDAIRAQEFLHGYTYEVRGKEYTLQAKVTNDQSLLPTSSSHREEESLALVSKDSVRFYLQDGQRQDVELTYLEKEIKILEAQTHIKRLRKRLAEEPKDKATSSSSDEEKPKKKQRKPRRESSESSSSDASEVVPLKSRSNVQKSSSEKRSRSRRKSRGRKKSTDRKKSRAREKSRARKKSRGREKSRSGKKSKSCKRSKTRSSSESSNSTKSSKSIRTPPRAASKHSDRSRAKAKERHSTSPKSSLPLRERRLPIRKRRTRSRERRTLSRERRTHSRERRKCSRERRTHSSERRKRSRERRTLSRERRKRSRERRTLSRERRKRSRERRTLSRERRTRSRERRTRSRERRSCSRNIFLPIRHRRSQSRQRCSPRFERHSPTRMHTLSNSGYTDFSCGSGYVINRKYSEDGYQDYVNNQDNTDYTTPSTSPWAPVKMNKLRTKIVTANAIDKIMSETTIFAQKKLKDLGNDVTEADHRLVIAELKSAVEKKIKNLPISPKSNSNEIVDMYKSIHKLDDSKLIETLIEGVLAINSKFMSAGKENICDILATNQSLPNNAPTPLPPKESICDILAKKINCQSLANKEGTLSIKSEEQIWSLVDEVLLDIQMDDLKQADLEEFKSDQNEQNYNRNSINSEKTQPDHQCNVIASKTTSGQNFEQIEIASKQHTYLNNEQTHVIDLTNNVYDVITTKGADSLNYEQSESVKSCESVIVIKREKQDLYDSYGDGDGLNFVIPIKKMMNSLRSVIRELEIPGRMYKRFIDMIKSLLRDELHYLLDGRGFMSTKEIIDVFRLYHPKEDDKIFLSDILQKLKSGCSLGIRDTGIKNGNDNDIQNSQLVAYERRNLPALDCRDEVTYVKSEPVDTEICDEDIQNSQLVAYERRNLPALDCRDEVTYVKSEPVDTEICDEGFPIGTRQNPFDAHAAPQNNGTNIEKNLNVLEAGNTFSNAIKDNSGANHTSAGNCETTTSKTSVLKENNSPINMQIIVQIEPNALNTVNNNVNKKIEKEKVEYSKNQSTQDKEIINKNEQTTLKPLQEKNDSKNADLAFPKRNPIQTNNIWTEKSLIKTNNDQNLSQTLKLDDLKSHENEINRDKDTIISNEIKVAETSALLGSLSEDDSGEETIQSIENFLASLG